MTPTIILLPFWREPGSWGWMETVPHKEGGLGRRDSFHWTMLFLTTPPTALLKNRDQVSRGNLLSYHEMSSTRSCCCFIVKYPIQNYKSEGKVWRCQNVLSFPSSLLPLFIFVVLLLSFCIMTCSYSSLLQFEAFNEIQGKNYTSTFFLLPISTLHCIQ